MRNLIKNSAGTILGWTEETAFGKELFDSVGTLIGSSDGDHAFDRSGSIIGDSGALTSLLER